MAGKGLGTGLEALFGAAALEEPAGDSVYLPITRVEPRQDQPRTTFDEAALAELSESIREHGLIQPLTVREIEDGYYQIIAGERRWRAARLAGLEQVPVRILKADDQKAMELALVENLQRENLNPVEEAAGYRALIKEYGLKQEEVARRVGKSRPVVANALRILTLPAEVQQMIQDGALSLSLARILLELETDAARIEAANLAAEKGLTVQQLAAYVKRHGAAAEKKKKEEKRSSPDGVDYLNEAEKQLTKKLCRKVKIVEGRRKGRFEIEYYGEEDFEQLYNALEKLKLEDKS